MVSMSLGGERGDDHTTPCRESEHAMRVYYYLLFFFKKSMQCFDFSLKNSLLLREQ